MYIEQLYTGCLAEAAYYVESEGEVAIIDPLRETEPYTRMAQERGDKIKYIFETHFHADFVSGHVDLARETGARIIFGPTAQTGYDALIAEDGQEFHLGKLRIKVLHTPGHTPESVTYLLYDENGKEHCIFSGDTIFIGDVGRPDLAIKSDLTQEDLAGMLYDSIREKIYNLPDDVIVYPAHGAGSACGKNISSETHDTLGNQKKTNYALAENMSREDFIKELTTGILPAPQYFAKAAYLNKEGYGNVEDAITSGENGLSVAEVKTWMEKGALLLDTRSKGDYVQESIPGSVFIGIDGGFAVWVGTLIEDMKGPIVIVTDEGRESEVVMRLARVGYDNCVGYLTGGLEAWKAAGNETRSFNQITAEDLAQKIGTNGAMELDVRKPGEYEAEHVKDAITFPLDFINSSIDQLDPNQAYNVYCRSGYRSVVTMSILANHGFDKLTDVAGGIQAILETDIPTTDFQCASS